MLLRSGPGASTLGWRTRLLDHLRPGVPRTDGPLPGAGGGGVRPEGAGRKACVSAREFWILRCASVSSIAKKNAMK